MAGKEKTWPQGVICGAGPTDRTLELLRHGMALPYVLPDESGVAPQYNRNKWAVRCADSMRHDQQGPGAAVLPGGAASTGAERAGAAARARPTHLGAEGALIQSDGAAHRLRAQHLDLRAAQRGLRERRERDMPSGSHHCSLRGTVLKATPVHPVS